MKIIKKFWGVALVLVLLSTMFLSAAPVSAANYNFSADLSLPSVANGMIGGGDFNDVAQSGSVIYAAYTIGPVNLLYTSPNGGGIWYPVAATGLAAAFYGLVAVAPDNPQVVAVVDTLTVPNAVYISLNGGTTFRALGALPALSVVDSIDISALSVSRYLAVGGYASVAAPIEADGNGFIMSWEIEIATNWVDLLATALSAPAAFENSKAVAFSEGFAADQVLLSVDETIAAGVVNGLVAIDAYSYNFNDFNAGFETTFPRIIAASTAPAILSCARASFALDADFVLGDNELGFVGLELTGAAGEIGGVIRINTGTPALTQIYTTPVLGNGINSVAWDGTNLMAADYDTVAGGALTIFRCANALASSGWTFLPSAALKTPGTGTLPLVLFNGGAGFAFSTGTNAAVAKTTDFGRSFDGVALVNSSFADMIDFWVSNDGTRFYALTDDTTDTDMWAKADGVWKRVGILAADTGNAWLIRAAQSDPNVVYMGRNGTRFMFKSLDGGAHVWTQRTCTQNIQDFAVQNATTVYVAVSAAGTVVKTVTGGSGWLPPVNTNMFIVAGGNTYSINLVANDQLVVGGTAGGVSYSSNGGTSWNFIGAIVGVGGNTLATATTTNGVISTGDTIFAATSTGAVSDIAKWVIGTNTAVTDWDYDILDAGLGVANITGLVYTNGVLYAWDDTATTLYRFILPVFYVVFADDVIAFPVATGTFTQVNMINALQSSVGSTVLWARNSAAAPDTLVSYTEYLVGAAVGPVPTYPINDAIVTVNSIAGNVNNFVFKWNCPPAISTAQFYTFDIEVFLDEAGTILVGADAGIGNALGGFTSSIAASALTAPAFFPVPGTSYFWHVRTATPVTGYWSAMQTFAIQQLVAIVPVQTSPVNGTVVEASNAAFSWLPISGATSYTFQLDTGAVFTAPLYSATVTSAGASLPPTVNLEAGRTYFWRVKVLTPTEGEWSSVANFIIAGEETSETSTTTTTTTTVTNTTITIPAGTTTVITVPPATQTVEEVNPTYIWAIIIIGAVLVLAVIVLIVRTRRSV